MHLPESSSPSKLNFKRNQSKTKHNEQLNQDSKNAKHFFNFIYCLYKNNNHPKEREPQLANVKKFKSFIKHPKSGVLSSQSQKEVFNNALLLLKNQQNRSESAKAFYPNHTSSLDHVNHSKKNSKSDSLNQSFKPAMNSKVIFQIEKQKKGGIPFLLPAAVTYMNDYSSFSERTRHQKLIDLYNKLKHFNENKPEKVNDYLKEVLVKNGISEDEMFKENKLNNLKDFILNQSKSVKPSKGIKDIIGEGLNYPKDRAKDGNASNKDKNAHLHLYLSRNIINKTRKMSSNTNMNGKNSSLSIAKIDLFKYMNMNKQKKINCENERLKHNNSKNDNSALINELENDINAALKKRENKFKEMNRTLMNSFSFLTSNMHHSDNNIHNNKAKINERLHRKKEVQPFMLTISRVRSRLKNRSFIENESYNPSLNARRNDSRIHNNNNHNLSQHKLQRAFSTNQINQRLYYDYVNRDKSMNEFRNIKKALKLTEYILFKQTKNRQCIEKAMKILNIED